MKSIISYIIACLIAILGFAVLFIGLLYHKNNYWILGAGCAIVFVGIKLIRGLLLSRYETLESLELLNKKNREWYLSTNSDCLIDSKIICAQCNSKAILSAPDSRVLEKQLFLPKKYQKFNRHYCKHCGSILFYTPISAGR